MIFVETILGAPNPIFGCRIKFFQGTSTRSCYFVPKLTFLAPLYANIWERPFDPKYSIKIMLSVFQTNITFKFHIC